jgi:hypothetical protein
LAYLSGAETLIRNITAFAEDSADLRQSPSFIEIAFTIRTLQAKWDISKCIAKLFSDILMPNPIQDGTSVI